MVYAKKITRAQRAWLEAYEAETTFEPMSQEALDDGTMTFAQVVDDNVKWFENWASDALLRITESIPE